MPKIQFSDKEREENRNTYFQGVLHPNEAEGEDAGGVYGFLLLSDWLTLCSTCREKEWGHKLALWLAQSAEIKRMRVRSPDFTSQYHVRVHILTFCKHMTCGMHLNGVVGIPKCQPNGKNVPKYQNITGSDRWQTKCHSGNRLSLCSACSEKEGEREDTRHDGTAFWEARQSLSRLETAPTLVLNTYILSWIKFRIQEGAFNCGTYSSFTLISQQQVITWSLTFGKHWAPHSDVFQMSKCKGQFVKFWHLAHF